MSVKSFLLSMCTVAWSCFQSPLQTAVVDTSSGTVNRRDTLMAHVAQLLLQQCGGLVAGEHPPAQDVSGIMKSEPVAAFEITATGIESIPVDPARNYKGRFSIDEISGQVIVIYADAGMLSGSGGGWRISLNGSVKTLYTMRS